MFVSLSLCRAPRLLVVVVTAAAPPTTATRAVRPATRTTTASATVARGRRRRAARVAPSAVARRLRSVSVSATPSATPRASVSAAAAVAVAVRPVATKEVKSSGWLAGGLKLRASAGFGYQLSALSLYIWKSRELLLAVVSFYSSKMKPKFHLDRFDRPRVLYTRGPVNCGCGSSSCSSPSRVCSSSQSNALLHAVR